MVFQQFIDDTRRNFGDPPRKFGFLERIYLKIRPPSWINHSIKYHNHWTYSRLLELYKSQQLLYKNGKIVWGHIIQANEELFSHGSSDSPAAIVYSLSEAVDEDPELLRTVSRGLGSIKGKQLTSKELQKFADKLAHEATIDLKIPIPKQFSFGLQFYYSVTVVIRKHLPKNHLVGSLFPFLICPTKTDSGMILPGKYWSKEFLNEYWLARLKSKSR